ncbi:MAG: carboxypeptidase-like regulatory domain-containing protein, partial [Acidobacteria bacterium]|nr:carboxypeptidase-like regulatory domain-containing protein [Acidobacteriota bacterium]
MTDNEFGGPNLDFVGAGVFAFDRAKMLAGDPTASFIYFHQDPPRGGQLPADLDGLNPPPAGAPALIFEFVADEFTPDPLGGVDAVLVFEFNPDFDAPANSTFTLNQTIPVAAFDPRDPNFPNFSRRDIEQPSAGTPAPPAAPTFFLDSIQDRLMFRLAYRNLGGREALVVNHTVNVSGVTPSSPANHQSGVRYYEFSRSLPSGFAVFDQGTFAPGPPNGSTGDNRWMGSVAQDNQGNLAVGYSVSGVNTFPSIRYTGRLASAANPGGSTLDPETTLIAGTGVQRSTGNRWGDYSAMAVDPLNDCDFWYTQEYYTAEGQAGATTQRWQTRIGKFAFPSCTAPPQGTLQVNVTNCATGLPVQGAAITINGNLYDTTEANGQSVTQLPPGTYTVTISGPNFFPVTINNLVITNGNTTIINQCLTPTPQGCTPTTTVSEGDLFPGGIASFGVTSGPNSVTVDHVNAGTGLQSFTVVSATNA